MFEFYEASIELTIANNFPTSRVIQNSESDLERWWEKLSNDI